VALAGVLDGALQSRELCLGELEVLEPPGDARLLGGEALAAEGVDAVARAEGLPRVGKERGGIGPPVPVPLTRPALLRGRACPGRTARNATVARFTGRSPLVRGVH
jgi:hypothetical protein